MFYNISWSTEFELEKALQFQRADQYINFKQYFRGMGSIRFSKTDLSNKNISDSVKKLLVLIKESV